MSFTRRALRHALTFIIFLSLIYFLYSYQNAGRPPLSIVKSSFDWSTLPPTHPVTSITELPMGRPHQLRRIQYGFSRTFDMNFRKQNSRRRAVRKAFQKCWQSYRRYAWMKDELTPVSAGSKNTFGGWAATLVDSLDTLWIMGLKTEFREAVSAVAVIDWANTTDTSCNMFEVNIRHLGGLLAAYDLSREPVLLDKAIELGDMLYAGFDTPNRMPPTWLDYALAKSGNLIAEAREASAIPGSFSMEFTRLSQLTGDSKYYDAISRITDLLDRTQNQTKLPGMWPTYLNLRDEDFGFENTFTLGALADSLYEYLPKMFALMGGLEPVYEKMYRYAAETIKDNLLFRPMTPENADILFSGSAVVYTETALIPEGQHLGCFVGGMYALGGKLFDIPEHVDLGSRLTRGCIYAYDAFPTGIMPETFKMMACESLDGCGWNEQKWLTSGNFLLPRGFQSIPSRSYILRPEAIESVFLLYRITGQTQYQDAAWQMFQSIQKATAVDLGNSAIEDVTVNGETTKTDSMESFWLGETLKYFYLIFSPPELISLDDYVFNTEAHPLKRPK